MLTPQVFFSTGRTLLRGARFIRQALQGRLYPEPIPHEALREALREARAAIDRYVLSPEDEESFMKQFRPCSLEDQIEKENKNKEGDMIVQGNMVYITKGDRSYLERVFNTVKAYGYETDFPGKVVTIFLGKVFGPERKLMMKEIRRVLKSIRERI